MQCFQSGIASRPKKDGACVPTSSDSPTVPPGSGTPDSPVPAYRLGSHGRSTNHGGLVMPPNSARPITPRKNCRKPTTILDPPCKMNMLLRKPPYADHEGKMFHIDCGPVMSKDKKSDASLWRSVGVQGHELLTTPRQEKRLRDRKDRGWPQ